MQGSRKVVRLVVALMSLSWAQVQCHLQTNTGSSQLRFGPHSRLGPNVPPPETQCKDSRLFDMAPFTSFHLTDPPTHPDRYTMAWIFFATRMHHFFRAHGVSCTHTRITQMPPAFLPRCIHGCGQRFFASSRFSFRILIFISIPRNVEKQEICFITFLQILKFL